MGIIEFVDGQNRDGLFWMCRDTNTVLGTDVVNPAGWSFRGDLIQIVIVVTQTCEEALYTVNHADAWAVEFFVVIILMVHPLTPQLTIGLSPNIAVPTRTTFAPSAIAKGKSPDIPIERMP